MKTYTFLVLAFLTCVSFVGNNVFASSETVAKIVSDINTVSGSLMNTAAQTPAIAGASSTMQAQLSKCMADAGMSDASAALSKVTKKLTPLSESCKKAPYYKDKIGDLQKLCSLPLPAAAGAKSCSAYVTRLKDSVKDISKEHEKATFNETLFNNDKNDAECYAEIQSWKIENCGGKDLEEFKKQYKAVQCQMDALQQGVADASKKVQEALNANNTKFGEMLTIEKELVDQKKQITDMLGPDPELGEARGFSGLIALQKKIEEAVSAYKSKEAEFTNSVAQIKEDTQKNEQNLESSAMGVVTSCMQGDRSVTTAGGKSLMCSVAVQPMSADGKPLPGGKVTYQTQACGPMEWLRSKVRESAYRVGNGVRTSAFRNDEANKRLARFDGAMQSILRDLGAYDNADAGGNKLQTRIQNWDQFNQKYGSSLANLSKSIGYDVSGSVKKVTEYCFKESKTWKSQQMGSASSAYRTKKKEIEDNKNKLANTLEQGLTSLNSNYSEVVAALGGNHVALNRSSCSSGSDLDKMNNCYKSIQKNLTDLLEGNSTGGANTFSTKTIVGNKVPGFKVVCSGINGCITDLKKVRDTQAKAITYNRQQRNDWVNKGNSAVNQTITSFATSLNSLQNNVLSQYSKMKEKLIALGVGGKIPDRPKLMKTSQLAQSDYPATEKGLPDEKGPYKMPENGMDSVFAGMMQPGLIDFSDSGFKEALTAAEEKAEKNKEAAKKKADDAAEKARKFAEISPETGCDKYDIVDGKGGGSSSEVGAVLCENCGTEVNGCLKALGSQSEADSQKLVAWEKAVDSCKSNCKDDQCKSACDKSNIKPASNTDYAKLSTQLYQILDAVDSLKQSTSELDASKLDVVDGFPFHSGCETIQLQCKSRCVASFKTFVGKKADQDSKSSAQSAQEKKK